MLTLKRHKRGSAYCRYKGKCNYFGRYGTRESQDRFEAWLATIQADDQPADRSVPRTTLLALASRFMEHARIHYCKDGQPPGRRRTFVSHSGNSVLKQSYKDRISRRSPDATSDNPHDVRPMANGRALLPRGLPVLNSLTDRHWVGVALNYELDDHQLLSAREMLHDCHVFQPEARHSSGAAGGPIMATHQPRARHVAN